MQINFNDLIPEIEYLEQSKVKYYCLNSLEEILHKKSNANIKVDDMIITPFYISSSNILELYDYELNIRNVKQPNFKQFILSKTGKNTMEEINSDIFQKLKSCYIEVVFPQEDISVEILNKYINVVKNSTEISERVLNCFKEFNSNNLYFEVY